MANPKVSDLFNSIAEKIGIDKEDQNFKALLSNDALQKEVSPDLIEGYTNGLLTLEAAKNNNDLHQFYKSKTLSTIDNKLKNQLKSIGVPEEKVKEFDSIEDSYEKVEKLGELVKNHFSTHSTEGESETVKKLKTEYYASQNKLAEMTSTLQAKESQWESEKSNIEVNFALEAEIRSVQFSDAFSNGDGITLLKTKLKDSPYVFKKDETGNISVFQKANPDLEAFDEKNRKLSMRSVIDQLSQPYVKKTPPQTPPATPASATPSAKNAYVFGLHKQVKSA